MSQAALMKAIDDYFSENGINFDPVAAIVESEQKRNFRVIRPGDVPWFSADDWVPESVASVSGQLVRLVLLHAIEPGKGTFTRTLKELVDAGYNPAVIDPTEELAATLRRRGWKGRLCGSDFETFEYVWRPRK